MYGGSVGFIDDCANRLVGDIQVQVAAIREVEIVVRCGADDAAGSASSERVLPLIDGISPRDRYLSSVEGVPIGLDLSDLVCLRPGGGVSNWGYGVGIDVVCCDCFEERPRRG